jgi:hypothetical protein
MKRIVIAGILIAGALAACNDDAAPSPPTETHATTGSPGHSSAISEADCVERGDALVKAFFEVLNRGDSDALKGMFPSHGSLEFSFVPDILVAAETSVSEAGAAHQSSQTFELADIDGVMSRISGLRFALTTPVQGGTYIDLTGTGKLMYGFGPVLWMATGPALESRGRTTVAGGGKIAIDCESGLFRKFLLSPLTFDEPLAPCHLLLTPCP